MRLLLISILFIFTTNVYSQNDYEYATEEQLFDKVSNFIDAVQLGFKAEALIHYPTSEPFYKVLPNISTYELTKICKDHRYYCVEVVINNSHKVEFYLYEDEGSLIILDSKGLLPSNKDWTDRQVYNLR